MATSTKTSATNADVYTASSGVTAVSGNKIADFEGDFSISARFSPVLDTEMNRFASSVWWDQGIVTVTVEKVKWAFGMLNKLWDISVNASDTLADGSTAASSYTISQSTYPPLKELLFHFTHTGDGKKVEVFGDRVVCPSLVLPFPKLDIVQYNVQFLFMGDGSGNVIKVSKEN